MSEPITNEAWLPQDSDFWMLILLLFIFSFGTATATKEEMERVREILASDMSQEEKEKALNEIREAIRERGRSEAERIQNALTDPSKPVMLADLYNFDETLKTCEECPTWMEMEDK